MRKFSAVCHSLDVTLFSLNRSLLRNIFNENPNFESIFKEVGRKKMDFRSKKLQIIVNNKPTERIHSEMPGSDPKFYSLRATEEDIDRFIRAPLQTDTNQTSSPTEDTEIKVRVKAFEDRKKKCLFFRGKRLVKKKGESMNTDGIYEIDNSEKKFKDRGNETNFLKEIIRNNQKCYRFLDQRSVKFTRDEILEIFDKEKLQQIENRKRLKKKYGEKASETQRESNSLNANSFSNNINCNYSRLYDEIVENQKKKKIKVRCQSAINFERKKENALEKTNEKGEIKINYHVKRNSSSEIKKRPVTARPVSGGYFFGKSKEKKIESFKNVEFYNKIKSMLIQGKTIGIKNSNLRSLEKRK